MPTAMLQESMNTLRHFVEQTMESHSVVSASTQHVGYLISRCRGLLCDVREFRLARLIENVEYGMFIIPDTVVFKNFSHVSCPMRHETNC